MTTETTITPLQKLAKDAIAVQDACNLSGVAISFGKMVPELRTLINGDTDTTNHHPIVKLWIFKLADLAGLELECNDYSDVWEQVRKIAEEVWVTQDKVPARIGIDQYRYSDWDEDREWKDVSVGGLWDDDGVHGYVHQITGGTLSLRCRPQDYPIV